MPTFHLKAVKMKWINLSYKVKGSYTRRQAKKIEKIYQSFGCSYARHGRRVRCVRLFSFWLMQSVMSFHAFDFAFDDDVCASVFVLTF